MYQKAYTSKFNWIVFIVGDLVWTLAAAKVVLVFAVAHSSLVYAQTTLAEAPPDGRTSHSSTFDELVFRATISRHEPASDLYLMLTAPVIRRFFLHPSWSNLSYVWHRCESSAANSNRGGKHEDASKRSGGSLDEKVEGVHSNTKRWSRSDNKKNGTRANQRKPSLMEQLFPEETKRYEDAQRKASRETPRLPLEKPLAVDAPNLRPRDQILEERAAASSPAVRHLWEERGRQVFQSEEPTVLVMRNASKNLLEDDFRRLIPQGKHLEGWSLDQGDILKIIPGRDLATLAQLNFYYLLFANKISAFSYQGHATRIFRMAATQTPSSLWSPLAPPPGYMIDGIDAHAAIESFSLVPASQKLELRQLQPPLSPLMQSIVRNLGYAAFVRRPDKMPFEVRLTMEGPQLTRGAIRHMLLSSADDRALGWSGGDEKVPKITEWVPKTNISPAARTSRAHKMVLANERTEEEQMQVDILQQERLAQRIDLTSKDTDLPRRTPASVYIIGFHTELAAQLFVRYWHRRPVSLGGEYAIEKLWENDLPPIANAEMLW